jgi:nicotinate (nicotinamide) nucleotide adenylyltransferase
MDLYEILLLIILAVGVLAFKYQYPRKKSQVLLFGLSGNPPTGDTGHRGIVKQIAEQKLFDEIWILPVYSHTFSSKKNLLPFKTRMDLSILNFQDLPGCKVLPIEQNAFEYYNKLTGKAESIGTIGLLNYLKPLNNSIEYTFCLGTDTFNDLIAGKWNDDGEIIRTTNLLVINRQGYLIEKSNLSNKKTHNIKYLSVPYTDQVSSTLIKESLLSDQTFAKEKLYGPVFDYICKHNLYMG